MGATTATAPHARTAHASCHVCSIKDGRYLSQKWRMLHCGLGGRLYLVETTGDWNLKEKDKKVRGAAGVQGMLMG